MPAKPSWAWRLPQALAALRASEDDWIDRRRLEELLGVSKTVAWRLLRACGIQPGPGGALAVRREDLIARLERLAQGGPIAREIARRERLEELLARLRPAVLANLTPVAGEQEALALLSTRFDRLPAHITLTATSLHIEFQGSAEFLKAVGALVYALHNDYEALCAFLDEGTRPVGPELPV